MMNDLNHRAMLASLTRRIWQAATVDRDIAEQAENETGAVHGSLKVIKELVPSTSLKKIKRVADIGYIEHCNMTVPGFIRGQNLLCTAAHERYTKVQAQVRDAFDEAVLEFTKEYPKIVAGAPKRLKRAFKESDFPSPAAIPSYFEYKIQFFPVPTVDDWRVEGLADGDMEQLRIDAEASIKSMYNDATRQVFYRARVVLEKIANQAKDYVGGPGASLLRDATIENLKEVSELVSMMNISEDPLLYQIGKEMTDHFANIEGPELRKSAQMRKDVASAAASIMKRIAVLKQ
jgi:hypothetical protein